MDHLAGRKRRLPGRQKSDQRANLFWLPSCGRPQDGLLPQAPSRDCSELDLSPGDRAQVRARRGRVLPQEAAAPHCPTKLPRAWMLRRLEDLGWRVGLDD